MMMKAPQMLFTDLQSKAVPVTLNKPVDITGFSWIVNGPISAIFMPNGEILMPSMDGCDGYLLLENGKKVTMQQLNKGIYVVLSDLARIECSSDYVYNYVNKYSGKHKWRVDTVIWDGSGNISGFIVLLNTNNNTHEVGCITPNKEHKFILAAQEA